MPKAAPARPQAEWRRQHRDVKNGSSTCDDARFADLSALYDTFDDPFVLTPGDNEWTDCHRAERRHAAGLLLMMQAEPSRRPASRPSGP